MRAVRLLESVALCSLASLVRPLLLPCCWGRLFYVVRLPFLSAEVLAGSLGVPVERLQFERRVVGLFPAAAVDLGEGPERDGLAVGVDREMVRIAAVGLFQLLLSAAWLLVGEGAVPRECLIRHATHLFITNSAANHIGLN